MSDVIYEWPFNTNYLLIAADRVKRVKRDSEAEADSEAAETVYEDLYTAISEGPGNRDKRQQSSAGRIKSQQQSRDGKHQQQQRQGRLVKGFDMQRLESLEDNDMLMAPSVRHTASIGHIYPMEEGFIPSAPVERFARGTVSPAVSSTPRVFQELVDLISPPFGQAQHNNNFQSTTNNNNNFAQSFTTSSPIRSSSPSTFSNSNNQFNNNNNNKFSQTTQAQNNFLQNSNNFNRANSNSNNNGFGHQSTRPIVQNTTPFPQTFPTTQTPSLPSSAAPNGGVFSQNLSLKPAKEQRQGKLKTGNGQPVQQSSKKPSKKKNKKSDKKSNSSDRQVTLFDVELVEPVKRQGKQSKQPPLTFVTSDLIASPSSSVSKLAGRQLNANIPGFPNGLPSQVPEGVRIALVSAQRGKLEHSLHKFFV